ncbi:response regulator [Paraburkholderia tagetis]|uniref:Response regulator n=1 Tax=Paraburkholderia tagetis TaxID=2913261 RepID=A0A9X1RSF9_9BURK|nr:response regulator [Paraburkholderia tagetis]MCG5074134.1 response regulator [Paraburkholderia tagetis]
MLDIDFLPSQAPILVATGSVADAELVASILSGEFQNVALSVKPEDAVADFETHRPAVLILAFDTLDACERYYADLGRLSAVVHEAPHRTLILCGKGEVWRAYELCRDERFDDYVLFWPITNDAPRLKMAVHHAMRRLKEKALAPVTVSELAMQAGALGSLEQDLRGSIAQFGHELDIVGMTVRQAEQAMNGALDGVPDAGARADLPNALRGPEHRGGETFGKLIRAISTAIADLQQRAPQMEQQLAAQLEPVRKVLKLSQKVRPGVLVVEDDEFQQKLIARLLAGQNLVTQFASCGSEAMALMWQRRPNLVLMDVGLPDISGVELTRRIRRIANFSEVKIVMVTGHSERQVVVESLQAGATDFLVKPLDKTRLLDKLRNFLPAGTPA